MSTSVFAALAVIFAATLIAAAALNKPVKVFAGSVLLAYLVFVLMLGASSNSAQSGFAIGWAFVPTLFATPLCAAAAAVGWLARRAHAKYVERSK